jgi:hypothetical protein
MERARWPALGFAASLLLVLVFVAVTGLRARGLSGLFPAVVGSVGAVVALVNLVQVLRGSRAGEDMSDTAGIDARWAAGLSLGVPTLYAMLLWLLGFFVASGVVLACLPWLLGYRRKLVILGMVVLTLLASQLVFVGIFEMRLPQGLVMERIQDARLD